MLGRALPEKAPRPSSHQLTEESVGICVARLLVGHRARAATTAARLFIVRALTTGVGVLAFFLLLAAGHVCFAAVFHVTAAFGILVGVLRVQGQGAGGNGQGRSTGEGH